MFTAFSASTCSKFFLLLRFLQLNTTQWLIIIYIFAELCGILQYICISRDVSTCEWVVVSRTVYRTLTERKRMRPKSNYHPLTANYSYPSRKATPMWKWHLLRAGVSPCIRYTEASLAFSYWSIHNQSRHAEERVWTTAVLAARSRSPHESRAERCECRRVITLR